MKTLSAFTTTAIDSPHVSPIYLFSVAFSGGPTVYLCDRVFGDPGSECVFDGAVYEPLVLSWGTIQHGKMDPVSYRPAAGEFSLTIENNTPVGGAECFTALFSTYDYQWAVVTADLIFEGASAGADKVARFEGQVEDIVNALADQVTLVCSGYELAVNNKFAHDVVDLTTYPNADPDDVGKMLPQVYGRAQAVPFLAVDAGRISTLVSDITATSTTLVLSDASQFPSSGTVQVHLEQITYTGKSSNSLTGCSRGANSTSARVHGAGAGVAEVKSEYFYIIGHAVKAISNVCVGNVRQSGNYTAYTGQSGDQHATYGAKACIKFTDDEVVRKLVDSIAARGERTCNSTDSDLPYTFEGDAGAHSETLTISGDGASDFAPSFDKAKNSDGFRVTIFWEVTVNDLGTAGWLRLRSRDPFDGTSYSQTLYQVEAGVVTSDALGRPWKYYTTTDEPRAYTYFYMDSSGGNWDGDVDFTITAIEITFFGYEQEVTGEVRFSGNSVADTIIGGRVSADVQGWQDDGSGTYTGTPDALIEQPDHILRHWWCHRCGLASAVIDSTSYTAAGTFFAANSYRLAPVILQRPDVRARAADIARQARSIEFWEAGVHHLVHIPDIRISEAVDKRIEANRVDLGQIWVRDTNRALIENTLSARYDRKWDGYGDEIESDRAVVTAADALSVTTFGTLQGSQRSYPYIIDEAQAQDVLDWDKEEAAFARLLVEFAGGYYLADIERGDTIDFSFTDGDELDRALLRRVTSEADQFRVIDTSDRPDGGLQVQAVKIPYDWAELRVIAAGSKTIASGATKYLHIDSGSGTYGGAQILGVLIRGVVAADWTVDLYVPTEDGATATQAADKRRTEVWTAADTAAGKIGPFSIAYDAYLDFTNDSGGSDDIDEVAIVYRAKRALTLTWES